MTSCPSCGQPLPDEKLAYCDQCGARLDSGGLLMLGSSLGLPVAAERPPEHSVSATPEPPAEAETGRFVPFASRLALRPPL